MSKQYQLTLSEEQVQVISKACELFGRLRLGQFHDILWKVFPEVIGANPNEDYDHRMVTALLDRVAITIRGRPSNSGSDSDWSDEARRAWDLHQVLRHRLSWDHHPAGDNMNVHFDDPLPLSQEPLARVECVDESI